MPEHLITPTLRQRQFLASPADEALYGGAASGGKSMALLMAPLRWIENPNFRGLYLRREATYLGDAVDKSYKIYPAFGGTMVQSPRIMWRFPSGATIWFSHCEHEKHLANYDSFEFSFIAFDELTHFTERQYVGLQARLRSTDASLPCIVRAGSNPGGEGHEWVFTRWRAWLDPKHERRSAPTLLRWFLRDREGIEREVRSETEHARSRTFVPALIDDNPHVAGDYRANLMQLDALRRAQLLGGDWLASPAAGLFFKRAWFTDHYLDAAPRAAQWCRYWDRAASIDGDWTVGAKWGRLTNGHFVLADVVRFRARPAEVEAQILATAAADGRECTVVLEQDPGQAGVADVDHLVTVLAGFNVRTVRPTGDKVTRSGPASAQCEQGHVAIVRGQWLDAWLAEHEAFPTAGVHDDQVDTTSGAVAFLSGSTPLSLGSNWSAMQAEAPTFSW